MNRERIMGKQKNKKMLAVLRDALSPRKNDATASLKTIYEICGSPSYRHLVEINPGEVPGALNQLLQILSGAGIHLRVKGSYRPEVIYQFITQEFFRLKSYPPEPGFSRNYTFEDFHPNHRICIEETATGFINRWINMDPKSVVSELAEVIVTNKGNVRSKSEVRRLAAKYFNKYLKFREARFYFSQISFNWCHEEKSGTGHAEGYLSFTGLTKTGDEEYIRGAFKFYLANEGQGWEIFFLQLPGYHW